jgi:hypothetical protein
VFLGVFLSKKDAIDMRTSQRTGKWRAATEKNKRREAQAVVREIVDRPPVTPPKDFIEARRNISDQVRGKAIGIVEKLIELAEDGEVAPAKYLFEMVGLYPATPETSSNPEDSLAYTLLKRMGLPTDSEECGDRIGT